jgi:hypothetical protein
MEVTAVWFGGETVVEGEYLSVRDVIDELNRRHPAAKYFKARNERGELLKPTVELTNKETIIVLARPQVYAEK